MASGSQATVRTCNDYSGEDSPQGASYTILYRYWL